ncbi:CDP-glycerol glycerophosphotransferase [Mobilisporobacter senegalensis]|uniref:CDP-glycerol glycerophosphotransferase n=1 Tax=Mobilisporobacter senegalensis TaxID=1329262 RepID=A0A3N1XPK4_9FIRM|nr:CDP-glycerol glycerophosphotransferase family protein [Mobilisporobacter senegalensis]ROR28620.1 CDP-glycerol glycerophosphotransferase [Mobilisporobacter senegalensis]
MKDILVKIAKGILISFYYLCTKVCKIKKDVIVFESNVGRNYSGNPKAIFEEMIKLGLDKKYHCYYILEDTNMQLTGNIRKVKRARLKYFYIMATAKIWISDSRFPRYIIKRKGVHYIQTWHGTPLKKLALDMDDVVMSGETTIDNYKKLFYENAQTWDYLVSQNNFSTNIFRRAFGFEKTMLEIGYPRNDTLVNNNEEEYIVSLKEKFGLPSDKRIILYAPTWRDNEFYGNGKYKFSPKLDFDMAREQLADDYVMIVKYHYLIMDNIDWNGYGGFIYAFDSSYDISDLYLVSDLLITDYSSVMFDYSLLRRPMFFYAYDLDNYKNNLRGFYFDFISEVPGPISLTTKDLIRDILNYDPSEYEEKYYYFTKKYNHLDDGKASQKVANLIEYLVKDLENDRVIERIKNLADESDKEGRINL